MSPRFARPLALLSFGWALLASLAMPHSAAAGSMDPALERLVLNPGCRTQLGAIDPAGAPCEPDQAAFTRLVSQFGFAFAPTALYPARTTGLGGFRLSLEGAFTKIDSDAAYWKDGTRGPSEPSLSTASIRNEEPASLLQLYSLRLQKGLGNGVELSGQFGFMPRTSFLSGGADIRWAILEGFRTGTMGYIPDVSVGGGARTTTGSAQMRITVASADVRLSKPITIRDEAVVTPWLGFQYLWIFGESGVVDLTPATNAAEYCDQQGTNLPGDPNAPPGAPRDGQPVCAGSPLDFENFARFDTVQLKRPRIAVGGNYRYELLSVSAQFLMDVVRPSTAQSGRADRDALRGTPRQWSLVLDAGLHF